MGTVMKYERITRPIDEDNFGGLSKIQVTRKLYRAYSKLVKHEDIEEELGIEFVTLFKALKNGIYVNEDYCDYGTTDNFLTPDNLDCDLNLKAFNTHLFFKDYGKTWALTKEELQ